MGELNGKNTLLPNRNGNGAASAREELLVDLSKKIQSLDNPVKLNILSSLVESGSLSITDIARKLNINFSTAHKYLEQLQAADLVTSRQISDNRLKRMFFIKDFNIELSPKSLFQKSAEANKSSKPKFKLLDNSGALVDFDEDIFAQKYIKRGMPRGTIILALQEVLPQAYDGMTLWELRHMFAQALEKKAENIKLVLHNVENDAQHKRSFGHILEVLHPEALRQHSSGDIFIRNLREPKLLKFAHDIRAIHLHGGVEGKKKAKEFGELLQYVEDTITAVYEYARGAHILDSFNYFIAPTVENQKLTQENIKQLREFLQKLVAKSEEWGIRFYIGLETGVPRWAKELSPYYFTEERKLVNYDTYKGLAQQIADECLKFLRENKPKDVRPVLKVWDKNHKFDKSAIEGIPNVLVANMTPAWQTINASFSVGVRFDAKWKNWMRTVKVGEVQNITINLPRLAKNSKNEKEFLQKLDEIVKQSVDYLGSFAELVTGEFLRQKTSFKSAQKERWDCAHIEDSAYYISISGLDEAAYILTGKRINDDKVLAQKVLKEIQSAISKYNKLPIRVELKEEPDYAVADRFFALDKKVGVPVERYNIGANCSDYLASAELHKLLPGGHCVFVSKNNFDFNAFVKAGGGLAKLT